MTFGHSTYTDTTGTGMTGHHHTAGTGLTGTGSGVLGTGVGHHHGHHTNVGAVGAGTAGTAGVAVHDTGAHTSAGASNVKATLQEKVAHAKADVVEIGQKLMHPTNPAAKMAATQEANFKKEAATERKLQEQALAGANEHGKMANARQGVANNLGAGHHMGTNTYNTNRY